MTSEAQKAASIRYAAKALKQIKINLHKEKDADIIARLEATENVQGYIKELIREDLKNSKQRNQNTTQKLKSERQKDTSKTQD